MANNRKHHARRRNERAIEKTYGIKARCKDTRTDDREPPTELWLLANPTIGGNSIAKFGLGQRRNELEKIVAPHVTTIETAHAILFRGRRCFLKLLESNEKGRLVWRAMMALQIIYRLEAAWLDHDIDTVARMSYGLAEYDRDIAVSKLLGCPVGANPKRWLDARDRGKTKKDKSKLREVDTLVLQTSYQNNRGRRGWRKAMLSELRERHGVTIEISGRRLSDELRRRGIIKDE